MLTRLLRALTGARATRLETDVAHTVLARAAGTTQIVDVREPDEWDAGHIPGALHIPLGDLGRRSGELDATRPVILVCRSGRRSLIAAEQLLNGGFTDAASLAGGMNSWDKERQPIEKPGR